MPFFDPDSASSLPAPYWFVAFFKTLGFALHSFPMELWLVGVPLAGLLWLFGGLNGRRQAQRLFLQTPVVLAIGINFGIVPLLFTQLAYSKAFYPPTILTATHWFSLLILALVGYYSAYLCASGADRGKRWSTTFFALVASCCLAGCGLIFSSVWTLIERPDLWIDLWRESAVKNGGAANGLATYWRDPIVYYRFASVVGLGFYAVACWIVFDAFLLYRGPRPLTEEEELAELAALEAEEKAAEESAADDGASKKKKRPKRKRPRTPLRENPEEYRACAVSLARCLTVVGLAIAGPALYKYYFQELKSSEPPLSLLQGTIWDVLTFGTLGSLVAPFVFLVASKLRKISGKTTAICLVFCEAATLGLFAAARQVVQNVRIAPYLNVRAFDDPSAVQAGPLFAFLGVFAVVAALVFWLIASAANAGKLPRPKKVRKPKKDSNNAPPANSNPADGGRAASPKRDKSGKPIPPASRSGGAPIFESIKSGKKLDRRK